jgi:hypothetical protein
LGILLDVLKTGDKGTSICAGTVENIDK